MVVDRGEHTPYLEKLACSLDEGHGRCKGRWRLCMCGSEAMGFPGL